jgi:hypothetical protein
MIRLRSQFYRDGPLTHLTAAAAVACNEAFAAYVTPCAGLRHGRVMVMVCRCCRGAERGAAVGDQRGGRWWRGGGGGVAGAGAPPCAAVRGAAAGATRLLHWGGPAPPAVRYAVSTPRLLGHAHKMDGPLAGHGSRSGLC